MINFKPFKGRRLDTSKPIKVYRNLNKLPAVEYSIAQGGLVRGHCTSVKLKNVRYKHATPKALREIREGNRQVCAWVTGELLNDCFTELPEAMQSCWVRLWADPKTHDCFTSKMTGKRIDDSDAIHLDSKGHCHAWRKDAWPL